MGFSYYFGLAMFWISPYYYMNKGRDQFVLLKKSGSITSRILVIVN